MAEAVVANPSVQRYFCHTCNFAITNLLEDYTCPLCGGGFVEEIQNSPPENENRGVAPGYIGDPLPSVYGRMEQNPGVGGVQLPNPLFFNMFMGGNQHQSVMNPRGPSTPRPGGSVPPIVVHQNPGGTFSFRVGSGPLSMSYPEGTSTGAPTPIDEVMAGFLTDMMQALIGQPIGGNQPNNTFVNFGDYAWGWDGLDSIVTQLMNQMEGAGPPPMSVDKLEQLPTVKITTEEVVNKLQCSVCWDEFKLDEEVKKLDCDHVYHLPCILPWLRLHGTCPICRRDFTLATDGGSSRPDPPPNADTPITTQANPSLNLQQPTQSQTGEGSNVNQASSNERSNDSRNNSGGSSRFNMDMDFD